MPLQKSFSDQNHSAKARQQQQNRPQWSRNKSFQGHQNPKQNSQSKSLQEKPALPVSTATKNKLSAFQFDRRSTENGKTGIDLVSSDDKENSGPSRKNSQKKSQGPGKPIGKQAEVEKVHEQLAEQAAKPEQAEQPLLPSLQRKNVPSTPASRLALPDLISMSDIQRAVQIISPDEKIEWDCTKDDSQASTPFGGIRRAKKRARSSSPMNSSPAQVSVGFSANNENPQLDPGTELWGRYSLNGPNAATPHGPSVPALAHLMQTSSPQPSKDGSTPRLISSFRRANSCGNQFPKRRKVRHSDGDVFTESENIEPSKLSVLIEQVQEGMSHRSRPSPQDESSSSSSTSPNEVSSPKNRRECRKSGLAEREEVPAAPPMRGDSATLRDDDPLVDLNSSDYGEFDDNELDVTMLVALEATSTQKPPTIVAQAAEKPSTTLQQASRHISNRGPTSKPLVKDVEDDEFGDLDDDVFDMELQQVASQFDRHAPISKPSEGLPRSPGAQHSGKLRSKPDSDDEFGGDGFDDDDFEAAVAATRSAHKNMIPAIPKVQAIQRYLVTKIVDSEFVDGKGISRKEKILFLQVETTKTSVVVNLRGTWRSTPATEKAYVHVIGPFVKGQCIIDDDNNILILHPDHLVSSTVVADSFACTRRAVLQDRVKATGDPAAPMAYGTILHEIFQTSLVANRWDSEWLYEVIEDIATKHVEDLYTIRKSLPDAIDYLQSKMAELQSWAELFVASQPNPKAFVKAGNGATASMCVSKLLDVEEHVWSPMYGLKGNIDATVQVTMQDGNVQRTLTVPFEVKTGKNPSASHRAQTALYNLLLSDRYDVEVAYGILYYMETSETIRIPKIRRELIHMIMQRNELACFVRERHSQLPPMLQSDHMCGRCYAKVPCFIYHRLADDGNGETSGMKTKFDDVVKHLTPKHKEFFLKWDDLLTKEEKESMKFRRELWTMLSSEREKLGRCFSNVVIEPGSSYEDLNNPKINRFHYTLTKQEAITGFSFLESQIVVGEPIVISDEKGHFALANGYVTKVAKRRITVAVDRRLHNARIRQPGFDEMDNQVFTSIMQVGVSPMELLEQKPTEEPVRYRLDKDEFSNGMATVRNNLIQVMADGPFGSRQIRSLVVDLNAPRFKTQSTTYVLKDQDQLNDDQKGAIHKVMSAEDYALVLGMPGTGKTTTIAHIIRALVAQGKSVLLTSYTHTAVDNILLKLKEDNMGVLRLGTPAKIHPVVRDFARLAATTKTTFEEIRSAWHDNPIVATTCLGINHALFHERTFDYCIVDEASQITLPVCLGPIRLAKTFILVGDHNQLPPLVQNEDARKGGLDISLFKHLSDTHPNSVVYLEHQYRMCKDVMALSNKLIYGGRLKCGSEAVAKSEIVIPNMDGLRAHHFSPSTISRSQKSMCLGPSPGRCWLRNMLDPKVKVAFLNTDTLLPESREQAKGNRIVNPTEATVCTQLVESLLSTGIEAAEIGVMTHYRSQLSLLKHGLRHHGDVEMHTADRFQGRDKEVIILSLVRSNEFRSIGELLKDWRRINVAFTRAKTKFLVIGSRETLKGNGKDNDGKEEMIAEFIKLLEEKKWIYDLPKGALEDHCFEEGGTQVTATAASRPSGTQFKVFEGKENRPADAQTKNGLGLSSLGGKENRSLSGGIRKPVKNAVGQKPFKMPTVGVMRDVFNCILG